MIAPRYYIYEGTPCRLEINAEKFFFSAEGYFAGTGFRPVSILSLIFHGEPVNEKEFKRMVSHLKR